MMKKRRIGIQIFMILILSLVLFAAIPAASALASTIPDGPTYGCTPTPPTTNVSFEKCWSGVATSAAPDVTFVLQKKVGSSGSWTDVAELTLDGTTDVAGTGNWEYAPWKGKFTNLPTQEGGKNINYRVQENNVPAGYTSSFNSCSNCFTNTVKQISMKVQKTWSDFPGWGSSATFTLYYKVDGDANWSIYPIWGTTIIFYGDSSWHYFWNLPLIDYATGKSIEYKVEETSFVVTDLSATFISQDPVIEADGSGGNKKITFNNVKVNYIDITFQKTWVDSVDSAATRPALTFDLYANGDYVRSLTLDGVADTATSGDRETADWKGLFAGLPDKDADGDITYTVEEDTLPGYLCDSPYASSSPTPTLRCPPPTPPTPTFTNTRRTVEIAVTKDWDSGLDEALPDGFEWPEVTIYLCASKSGAQYVYNETTLDDGESFTFTEDYSGNPLPLYEADGTTKINYTIVESGGLSGYTPVIVWTDSDGSDDDSYAGDLACTVTNTRDLIDVTVNKAWLPDVEPGDGWPNIEVILYQNGVPYYIDPDTEEPLTFTLNDDNTWSMIFQDLPTHSIDGLTSYTYTVDEVDTPEGYAKRISSPSVGRDGDITYTITNVRHCHIDIPVDKEWFDVPDAQHNFSITVQLLYFDGDNWVPVMNGSTPVRLTLNNGNNWHAVFTGIEQYDDEGEPILYDVEEIVDPDDANDPLNNYDAQVFLNDNSDCHIPDFTEGFTITNTLKDEDITICVTKVWHRDNPETRPQSVTFILYADGNKVNEATFSGTGNYWHYTFTTDSEGVNLPRYKDDPETGGKLAIRYTIEEESVGGDYVARINGFTITNTIRDYPDPPDDPDEPEEPEEPEPPVIIIPEPEPPTDEIPDIDVPLDESPKTGDQRDLALPMVLAVISLAAFFTIKRLVKDQGK